MPTYQYATGQNVSHNGNCCTVFRLRDVEGAPAYLLREIVSGNATDNVLESDISDCSTNHVVKKCGDVLHTMEIMRQHLNM